MAWGKGDLPAARQLNQRALIIREKLAPNSLDVAKSLGSLGNVTADQGDLAAARDYFQRALTIFEKLVPNSLDASRTLNNLGKIPARQPDCTGAQPSAH